MVRTFIVNHLSVAVLAVIAGASAAFGQASPIVIPAPASMQTSTGSFSIVPSTRIVAALRRC